MIKLWQVSSFQGNQILIYRFTQLVEDFNYKCIPVWYNVNRPTYDYLGKEIYERDKHKIVFHHYSGGHKPWEKENTHEHTWVDEYWINQYNMAKDYFGIKNSNLYNKT